MDSTEGAMEFYEERAAIMQYDGGSKRYDAQLFAEHLTRQYCDRTGKPLPEHSAFRFSFSRGSTAWDEDTGRAYYVPPPYERR